MAGGISAKTLRELWDAAKASSFDLSEAEFGAALAAAGTRYNFGLPADEMASADRRVAFYRSLHLKELALAHGCARGRDAAWREFLDQYRAALTQAAVGIARSSSLGEDLAGSLYSELFGLTERDGERRSPFASYCGRGSLMAWLRATLAQRHIDHHRRTRRETPLQDEDFPAETAAGAAVPNELLQLTRAVSYALGSLAVEDRFLLTSYFLDGRTLLELARLLRVHEATVSRRLKKLTQEVRKRLLQDLQTGGMSRRAAEEMLGTDPRDLDVNLRNLLQSSPPPTFSQETGKI